MEEDIGALYTRMQVYVDGYLQLEARAVRGGNSKDEEEGDVAPSRVPVPVCGGSTHLHMV